jgi:HK97 family phage major capsid protein
MPETLSVERQVEILVQRLNEEFAKADKRNGELITALRSEVDDRLGRINQDLTKIRDSFSVPGSGDARHKGQKFMFSRLFYAMITNDWSKAKHEKAICDEAREKAMATTPDSAGGFIVPIEVVQAQLIPLLEAKAIVQQLGATVLDQLVGTVLIPRVSGGTTAYWVSENSVVTASDLKLEQLRLEPKILATLTAMSELLANVGSPGIERMLTQDMAVKLANAEDLAALNGSGVAGQPTGIQQTTGVNTSAWTAGAPTYNELLGFVHTVRNSNALDGSPGWALSAVDFNNILKILDATNQPLMRRVLADGPADTILGYPYRTTTQLGTDAPVFGNFQDLVIGRWGGMVVETSNAPGFTSLQKHIRTHMFTDIGLRHVKSFTIK